MTFLYFTILGWYSTSTREEKCCWPPHTHSSDMRSDEGVEVPVHATTASPRPPLEHGRHRQAVFCPYNDAIVPRIMATPSQSRLPLDILACDKAVTACQWLLAGQHVASVVLIDAH